MSEPSDGLEWANLPCFLSAFLLCLFPFWHLFSADFSDGVLSWVGTRGVSAHRGTSRFCRFNDKVKHIKILTKDGCFYIAESRLFKSVLVRYFCNCCSVDCKHLDISVYL